MSERVELACWRVWNFMRAYDKRHRDHIHASVGVDEGDYREALGLLTELDVLEIDEDGYVRLSGDREDIPPFTAVFETRTTVNDTEGDR